MTDDEEHASLLKTGTTEAARLGAHAHETAEVANLRLWWGICYANAMGVCGIVLVALGSTLSALAADCGTTETAVGTVFIARGVGAITGALGSARLYAPPRRGNAVMIVVLLLLSVVLLYMPFVREVWVLHATWFLLGACTATLDTGCQIMTRKVHGVHAGPWLGANTVCFAIAGALVPLIEIVTGELFAQYATLARGRAGTPRVAVVRAPRAGRRIHRASGAGDHFRAQRRRALRGAAPREPRRPRAPPAARRCAGRQGRATRSRALPPRNYLWRRCLLAHRRRAPGRSSIAAALDRNGARLSTADRRAQVRSTARRTSARTCGKRTSSRRPRRASPSSCFGSPSPWAASWDSRTRST